MSDLTIEELLNPTEPLHVEEEALYLEIIAVTKIVTALRKYRSVLAKAESERYTGGSLDRDTIYNLFAEVEEIENELRDYT